MSPKSKYGGRVPPVPYGLTPLVTLARPPTRSSKITSRSFRYPVRITYMESTSSLTSSATSWSASSWFISSPRSSHLASVIITTIHHLFILSIQPQNFFSPNSTFQIFFSSSHRYFFLLISPITVSFWIFFSSFTLPYFAYYFLSFFLSFSFVTLCGNPWSSYHMISHHIVFRNSSSLTAIDSCD